MSAPKPRLVAVAGAVTAAIVGISVAREPVASQPMSKPLVAPDVPLAQVTLDDIITPRTPFCDKIPDEAVTTAVGGSAQGAAYTNGEETTLEPGLNDVANEFGCVYTHEQTVARIWVFAAPITPYDARIMVRDAESDASCTPTGPLRFGAPSAVLDCTSGDVRTLRAVGRIGDAWVHCELSTPAAGTDSRLLVRGQHWCVAAAYAMQ